MTDHIVSTKKVEEIILQEIPEGFFPHIVLRDLSTYINLLLRGDTEVHYKKDMARTHRVRHYTRHLSEIEKVLANDNRIPGFNLTNLEKRTLGEFLMKRLYGDTITIADVMHSVHQKEHSSEEILETLVAYDKQKLSLEEALFRATLEEYMTFLEEVMPQSTDPSAREGEAWGDIPDSKIRDLLQSMWRKHGREILTNIRQRLSILANAAPVADQVKRLDARTLKSVIKSYYTAVETHRLRRMPDNIRMLENLIDREQ